MGGRDSTGRKLQYVTLVSTHAPVGGRDGTLSVTLEMRGVSTHAPVGGRDGYDKADMSGCQAFQLTRPWEGATRHVSRHRETMCFNSRARGRARRIYFRAIRPRPRFNSRARGRARRPYLHAGALLARFNSRARGRARPPVEGLKASETVFQLTRPWEGATQQMRRNH